MHRTLRSAGTLLATLAGCLTVLVPAATAASSPPAVRLGSAPILPADAHTVAALPGAKQLQLTVALNSQDPSGLARFATGVATPASPLFHRYLTVPQFAQRFGAAPAQIATVQSALRAQGLSVGGPRANDLTLPVTGTAAQVEAAFSTSLSQVELPSGRLAYANSQAPLVPSSAAPYIQGVIGLDDLTVDQPQQRSSTPALSHSFAAGSSALSPQVATGGPQPCPEAEEEQEEGSYTADQIASAYQLSSLYATGDLGAGQTVALLELEPYLPSDIATYQACYGTSAAVSNVEVAGGPGPYEGEDGEAALDIEQIIGLAPKANILVYQSPNTENATVEVISAMVSQDTAKVISSSWGKCEAFTTGTAMNAENTLLQEAAAQGQSFFVSSGDTGSEACSRNDEGDTSLSVLNPASQPFATGVGGTTMSPPGPPPAEYVWNEGPYSEGGGGSGGGISSQWPMPAYQSGAAASLGVINANSSSQPCGASTDCREVPDVSADADASTGYVVYSENTWKTTGGTSAAAPLWAAFTGLANSSPACRGIPIGFANPSLYKIAGSSYLNNFHDVTQAYPGLEPNNDTLAANEGMYPVGPGYDMTTGIGTPIGPSLAASLCALASPVYTVAIASPGRRTNAVKRHLKLQIAGSDSGGAALSYSASGLPAGLSIDPAGLVSGTPTKVGASTVTVTARDAFTNGGSVQFKWVISSGLTASHAKLSGASKRKPSLSFALSTEQGTPGIGAVSVSLPHGLTLARAPRILKKGVAVTGVHGKRVAVKLKARHGSLRITLSHHQAKAKFRLTTPALGATASLASKIKRHKVKVLPIPVIATDSTHHSTRLILKPKVS
jgi:hypothetical protein